MLDLIKGAFLLETIYLFKVLRQIDSKQNEIRTVFKAIGQLDMTISVQSWRESLPFYCSPDIRTNERTFNATDMYHPLIEKPEANNLAIENDKSILLSGSNMSGKTTFIRTMGINTLLSQTINTACAKNFSISPLNIYSAIRISDNLLEDTSYYYEEVKTIKKLLEESQTENFNLFLLDEIFKGTNTVERVASGKAVLSFLHGRRNLVICATHDLELMDYLEQDYTNFHFTEKVDNEELTFDYKLKNGRLTNTNAIKILEINKFPTQITEESKLLAQEMLKRKGK